MSGDQLASRQDFNQPTPFTFGNPNAQSPTPKQTPTSATFPSPVFETPKQRQGHFDDAGGWTPRFAEEYSVFNTTPGNLRASPGSFPDFSTTTYPPSATLKRPLSAESLAAQIATHANHFSPNPNLPLPPVAAAQRLPSSPKPPNEEPELPGLKGGPPNPETVSQGVVSEKSKGRESVADLNGQTATPPPSSHKGGRKLVSKLQADNMQNDHGYGQPDFSGTPQHPNMAAAFVNATDMFGFPLTGPANGSASFWDPSPDMSGMDIDFSFGPNVFHTSGHRHMPSFDASQMFQEASALPPPSSQESSQPTKRTRPLAPKPAMHAIHSASADMSMSSTSFSTSVDDPFGLGSPGGVDPGLLFGRPSSSSMNTAIPMTQGSAQFALAAVAESQSRAPMHTDIRRSFSTKELGTGRPTGNTSINSPAKSHSRSNGLQRSVSENRGRRGLAKAALPKLAPAIQPRPQATNGPAFGPGRPPSRPSGRTSPLKHHHSRPSGLTSIPEATPPRTRTAVKFTIDSKGRARAEATMVLDDPMASNTQRRPITREMPRREKSWESDDDDSSTDDEPIIIPSRNTSFALPDPRRPSSASVFHSSRRSVSEHSSSSLGASVSQHDAESEAETIMHEPQGKGGDAASELRKLVENRQRRGPQAPSSQASQLFAPGSFQDSHGGLVSPTAFTEVSLPSPTKATYNVRCVCRNGANKQGEYMVQCESCEMWLHGLCINISRRTIPTVYICAFCSNTPNMRGGRLRGNGPALGPSGASPLARKSFR
ncbi:PHD-finger domain-containing protein [Colletotrichum graminicola M1.001]|uniref:PHD-finger domain-containing protein n=1 Tax=Colletotrichum graminicola (strain M1.001 / M2 / FGSC 10212) TaxID=645133 RepID=E3QCG2_COLGM|nr:PHD-finger domain-containing protein [Colletotrichum graminicola M1.001]EFQ28550.1 PHD-finger domain-containing protein [Colletotrichum graminicola M1.001]